MNKNPHQVQPAHLSNNVNALPEKLSGANASTDELLETTYYLLTKSSGKQKQAFQLFRYCLENTTDAVQKVPSFVNLPKIAKQNDIVIQLLQTALLFSPQSPDLQNSLACILSKEGQWEQAEKLWLNIHSRHTGYSPALSNLSGLYNKMSRYHDALTCAKLAVELSSNDITTNYNCAIALIATAQYAQAISYLEKTLALDPNNDRAIHNLSNILLKSGNFQQGWTHTRRRWNEQNSLFKIELPLWRAEPLTGKGLIIWPDRGLGDQIMYSRFFKQLSESGCRLSVICDPRMEKLYRDSFRQIRFYPLHQTQQNPTLDFNLTGHFHYHSSISRLAAYLINTFSDIGSGEPYLVVNRQLTQRYRQELQYQFPGKKLIGFSWRGGMAETNKYARNIALQRWAKLFANQHYQFVNLQYDSSAIENETIDKLGGFSTDIDCKNDIESLAALLTALDLVVSADNTTVHLAGALGVPTWTLIPFASDWRWFFEKEKSYWYNSIKLIQQQSISDWSSTIEHVENQLASWHANTCDSP